MSNPVVIEGKIKSWQMINTSEENVNDQVTSSTNVNTPVQNNLTQNRHPVRPQVVAGFTLRFKYGEYGSVYTTLNYDIVTNNLIEIFITSSQTSARNQAYTNVLARMISNQIKYSVPLQTIYKHMIGIDEGQASFVKFPNRDKPLMIKSIPDLIGNVLYMYPTYSHIEEIVFDDSHVADENYSDTVPAEDEKKVTAQETTEQIVEFDTFDGCAFNNTKDCPDANWIFESGCESCLTCGFSKCS